MKKILVLLCIVVLSFSACQTVDRGYENIVATTNPDRTKLNTKVSWLSPQPKIFPKLTHGKTVYCSIKNSAGISVDFTYPVVDELVRKGYVLVDYVDQASYILSVDIRNLEEKSTKKADAPIGGAAAGGVVGGVVGHNSKLGTGPGIIGGAVIGGLLGNIVANRNKDREYIFTIDVYVGERVQEGVSVSKRASSNRDLDSNVSSMNEFGHGGSTEEELQSYHEERDFYYHNNRLIISAKSLNLSLHEAKPLLLSRASMALVSILP